MLADNVLVPGVEQTNRKIHVLHVVMTGET